MCPRSAEATSYPSSLSSISGHTITRPQESNNYVHTQGPKCRGQIVDVWSAIKTTAIIYVCLVNFIELSANFLGGEGTNPREHTLLGSMQITPC